jgi:hypothetical protein
VAGEVLNVVLKSLEMVNLVLCRLSSRASLNRIIRGGFARTSAVSGQSAEAGSEESCEQCYRCGAAT